MSTSPQSRGSSSECTVQILGDRGVSETPDFRFTGRFVIGRTDQCDVCLKNQFVSRTHVEVDLLDGQWWARDLDSSNGVFLNGIRVSRIALSDTTVRLGVEGPQIHFDVSSPCEVQNLPIVKATSTAREDTIVAKYVAHYFGGSGSDQPVGDHTLYVRRAFEQVRAKQRLRFVWIIASLATCIISLAGYAFFQHEQISRQRAIAEDIFYSMKAVDVEIANLERLGLSLPGQAGAKQMSSFQARRESMERSYNQFLGTLRVYDSKMSPQDRLILRVARIFGECELDVPPPFVTEVKRYIQRWQSSGRLERAIKKANSNGYTATITTEFLGNDLPPQFFYLALQESDFDQYSSGPATRKGIAKGMWQFIPETALKYGLHLGPLVDLRRADPGDDRHHYELETKAAAHYVKDLYGTDGQASGLLVIACYNWGEGSVVPLVRRLPENPRERNFWRLLAEYKDKIPQETYDYVFYIFSAAVIGEDPHLFGFTFDDPLMDPIRQESPAI